MSSTGAIGAAAFMCSRGRDRVRLARMQRHMTAIAAGRQPPKGRLIGPPRVRFDAKNYGVVPL